MMSLGIFINFISPLNPHHIRYSSYASLTVSACKLLPALDAVHLVSHPISSYPRIVEYPVSSSITIDPWWLCHWYGMESPDVILGAVDASSPANSSL